MITDAAPQALTPPPAVVEAVDAALTRTTDQVTTRDGVQIAFDLYQRPGRDTVLIICPGFFQSKNTPTFRNLTRALAEQRDVVCLDFRGQGDSSGLYTFSAKEGADLKAVLTWAHRRYRHVALVGFSLGAATAIEVAGQDAGVEQVIAVSAPSDFKDIEFQVWKPRAIAAGIKAMEPGVGCRPGNPWLTKPRPMDRVHQVKVPILFVHGTADDTTFARHSERLFAVANEPKQLIFIPGGHAEALYRQDPAGFIALLEDWLQSVASQ